MKLRKAFAVAATAFTLLLPFTGCQNSDRERGDTFVRSPRLTEIHSQEELKAYLAAADKPVVLDIGTSWCGPCQHMKPILQSLSGSDMRDRVNFIAVDADEVGSVHSTYGVSGYPTLLVLSPDGTVLKKQLGAFGDEKELRDWIESAVGPAKKPARSVSYSL
jgi:thioredoxin 1